MADRFYLPYEELVIDGSLAFGELSLQSTVYDELALDGACLLAELELDTGYVPSGSELVYLISRNNDETIISRVGDARLTSRRSV